MRIEPANVTNVSVSTEKVGPRMESSRSSADSAETAAPMVSGDSAPAVITATGGTFDSESFSDMKRKAKGDQSMGEKEWIALIERANKAINGANKSFEYSIHEATKQIMVKIIDKDTKEVIREIPSEKILDMVAKMWEMNGLFVDERR